MSRTASPAEQVLSAYKRCVWHKDAAAFADLYDPDVEVFDAWDTWRLRGKAAVHAMATAWFQSLGDRGVEVTFADVQDHAAADVAAVATLVTYTAVAADGKALRGRTNRMSLVLRLRPEGWRVVHEHTSVPVGFESGQAVPGP